MEHDDPKVLPTQQTSPVSEQAVFKEQHGKDQMKEKMQNFERYWNIIYQKLVDWKEKQEEIQRYKQIFVQSLTDKKLDRALGSVYGAFIGDALGAYCEFMHKLDNQTVEEALQMNGGGTFNLQAGQFTDDSQLATHLLHGLSRLNQNKPLDKQTHRLICTIGLEYNRWKKSGPFDIGNTCRAGIKSLVDYNHIEELEQCAQNCQEQPPFFKQMFQQIFERTGTSLANGSLMRISPFALFFATLNEDPLKYEQFIKNEIRLTHSNPLLGEAGLYWVNILTKLIQRKTDKRQEFHSILYSHQSDERFSKIKSWLAQAQRQKENSMPANQNMGFAKIAFSYGLKILYYIAIGQQSKLDGSLYINWMRWIIKRAGDTDTNAAIAGGLLGSVIGFWNLPTKYVVRSLKTITDRRDLKIDDKEKQPYLNNKWKYQTPKRPSFYEPANAFLLALDVLEKCQLSSKNT